MVFVPSDRLKIRLVLCLVIVTALHLAGFVISLPETEALDQDVAVGVVLVPWQQDEVSMSDNPPRPTTAVAVKPAAKEPSVVTKELVKNTPSPPQKKPPTTMRQTDESREVSAASQPVTEKEVVEEAISETPVEDTPPELLHEPLDELPENPKPPQQAVVAPVTDSETTGVAVAELATESAPETSVEARKNAAVHRSDQQARPRYGHHPPPDYPRIARKRGWQGVVKYEVRVLSSGKVAELVLESSSGYRILDEAARKAIIRWRFHPAIRSGIPTESWVVIPIEFVLEAS